MVIAPKHEETNLAVISICLIMSFVFNSSQQYKRSNRGRDVVSYTFSFILAKTKSIQNNFYEVFVQISGKCRKYLANIGTSANV